MGRREWRWGDPHTLTSFLNVQLVYEQGGMLPDEVNPAFLIYLWFHENNQSGISARNAAHEVCKQVGPKLTVEEVHHMLEVGSPRLAMVKLNLIAMKLDISLRLMRAAAVPVRNREHPDMLEEEGGTNDAMRLQRFNKRAS